MSYTFPESLYLLRDFLKSKGADVRSFSTDRQAAFMAQQLIGSRFKFPERGHPLFPTMLKIQEAIAKAPARSRAPIDTAIGRKPKVMKSRAGKGSPSKAHEKFDEAAIQTGIHVFCDGACEPNPGYGGWGFVVYREGAEFISSSGGEIETTNNIMELSGMLRAIEWAVTQADAPVTIWCDSMYVVNGCNDWRKKWKANGWRRKAGKDSEAGAIMNLDLWKAIDEVLCGPRGSLITVRWVKGHNGTIGNERADELSLIGRQAAIEPTHAAVSLDLDAEYRAIMAGAH